MVEFNLGKAMTEFSDEVKRGHYTRIDYDSWQKLVKVSHYPKSEVIVCNDMASLKNTTIDGHIILIPLNKNYQEFRKFLYDYGYVSTYNKKEKEEKENTTMNIMPSMNLDFGPAGDNARFSPYGVAIKAKDDKWLVYDAHNKATIDVTGFTFDFGNMIYKMPVAIKDVRPGDVIVHNGLPIFVEETTGNKVVGIDIFNSEEKTVVPVTNMFGFNFVTKLMSLVNLNLGTPNPDQPFGNLIQMMLMSELFGGKSSKDSDFFGGDGLGKLMMLSAMTGQTNPLMNFGTMFTFTPATQE